jgi:hypothetical protein
MNHEATGKTYLDVEDLQVYQKLCQLHLEICDLSHAWPTEERYELGSQIRRSSIRMLNGLEKSLERHLPEKERRWAVAETTDDYDQSPDLNTEP